MKISRRPFEGYETPLFSFFFFATHIYFPSSGQAVWSQVSSLLSLPPSVPLPSSFIAHRVQQSPSARRLFFHRVFVANSSPRERSCSVSQFVHKKKNSLRICTNVQSGGFELTKLAYTRLEDNLTRHRGDRLYPVPPPGPFFHIYSTRGYLGFPPILKLHTDISIYYVSRGAKQTSL